MNEDLHFELLADIAKLMKKYGPEIFENLADTLSSPEFSQNLAYVLSTTARASRAAGNKRSHSIKPVRVAKDFRSSIIDLEQTQPKESIMLLNFYDDLKAKTILPTLREIQSFASDIGLLPLKATSRDKAIIPLVKSLMNLPSDDLASKISIIKPSFKQDDRSLEGWANVILGRDQPRNID